MRGNVSLQNMSINGEMCDRPLISLLSHNLQRCDQKVSLLIRRELFERAKDFNIILDDVAITELSFSREYTAAVEAKQVGEQLWTKGSTRCCCHPTINVAHVSVQPSRRRNELSSTSKKPNRTRGRRLFRLKEKLRLPRW